MFEDRKDAGQQLAHALEEYRNQEPLILAIPKGGVEVGYQVAKHLEADFAMLITRKLPFPSNPEAGFGAIAEDGSTFIAAYSARRLSKPAIHRIIQAQKEEIRRRIDVLREGGPLPALRDRNVILVDDGIAMGSTMRASIEMCKNQHTAKITVASPVASPRIKKELEELVDDIVVLETPTFFRAVAQVYENWYDVSDDEAKEIMNRWRKEHAT